MKRLFLKIFGKSKSRDEEQVTFSFHKMNQPKKETELESSPATPEDARLHLMSTQNDVYGV